MQTKEEHIASTSEYYVYTPSASARETFFYPVCTGYFVYEPGYLLRRRSYDSFWLMYIEKGRLTVEYEQEKAKVQAGSFLFLDCYQPHAYYTDEGCEAVWCHFDGPFAGKYYEMVSGRLGNVFSLENAYPVLHKLRVVFEIFTEGKAVQEALMSKYFTDIMTQLLLCVPPQSYRLDYEGIIEETISYMNEHLNEDISIKDICYQTGFSRENIFCASFKKNVGMTPKEYRFSR